MDLILETLTIPAFGENTFLLGDADAGEALAIDPGGRIDDLLALAERRGVRIVAVANTHAHIDHVAGIPELVARTGVPVWMHRDAAASMATLPAQAAMFGLPPLDPPRVDRELRAGEDLAVGGLRLELRDTPGHAPGHLAFVGPEVELDGARRRFAIVGDAIFLGGIGRVDLPGGDFALLMTSIEREILSLPPATALYPGHGPATTVARERAGNPFVLQWRAGQRSMP